MRSITEPGCRRAAYCRVNTCTYAVYTLSEEICLPSLGSTIERPVFSNHKQSVDMDRNNTLFALAAKPGYSNSTFLAQLNGEKRGEMDVLIHCRLMLQHGL